MTLPSPVTAPVGYVGIPLGISGLAGAWSAAPGVVAAVVAETLFAIAASCWAVLVILLLSRIIARRENVRQLLSDAWLGPFASIFPLVALILVIHYFGDRAGVVLPAIAIVVACGVGLFAHWLTGGTSMEQLHPGYFIPLVAGAFISSGGLVRIEWPEAAVGAFGAGAFLWLLIASVVASRLFVGGELHSGGIPTLSAFLAAPALAANAWIVAEPTTVGTVHLLLTGVVVAMLLVQVALVPRYVRNPFALSFWVFTFPAATTATYAVRLGVAQGSPATIWTAVTLGSAVVAFVAAVTLLTAIGDAGKWTIAASRTA